MLVKKEIELLRKLGLNYDYSDKLTEEEAIEVENTVGDYLTLECMDSDYNINEEGKICYSILDKIDDL